MYLQVNDLQSELARERSRASLSNKTLEESRSRIETLVNRTSDLESANLSLNQKKSDLAQRIEDERSSHRAKVWCFSCNILPKSTCAAWS